VRRLLQVVPLLFGLLTLVFLLSRLLPGDIATLYLSPTVSQSAADRLRSEFGLDQPLLVQYGRWMGELLRGNLGLSFSFNAPVTEILAQVFPNTVLLGIPALLAEFFFAIVLVAIAKQRPGSSVDRWISRGVLVVYALPSFWVGMIFLAVFSYSLGLFPSSNMWSAGSAGGWELGSIADLLRHLVLPVLTLAIPGAAGLARYLASTVEQTRNQEYVLAATAMGLSREVVFRRYILPNSMGPMIAIVGLEIGSLMTGVLVTETLFAWPGMGRLIVVSVFARDYPLLLGCTLLGGIVVVVGNLLADIAQAVIDPRVRPQ
jgi:ABC-type dipeptide/oligopeptide/nickel transport system permease component